MADITLSKATRSNLLNLQSSAQLLSRTQERLATGNKVNSALDNPTNFFTASSLSARASDLNLLQDSVANAVQTLEAADNGISSITKLVESAQATARQALQSPQKVESTGKVGSITSVTGIDVSKFADLTADTGSVTTDIATPATFTAFGDASSTTVGDGDKIGDVTVAINGKNVTFGGGDTLATFKAKLSSAAASTAGKDNEFTYDSSSGKLASKVSGQDLSIRVVSATVGTAGLTDAAPTADASTDIVLAALGVTTSADITAAKSTDGVSSANATDLAKVSRTDAAAGPVTLDVNGNKLKIGRSDSADTILSKFKQAAQKSRGTDGEFTASINSTGVLELQSKNDGQSISVVATGGDTNSVDMVESVLGLSSSDDLNAGIVEDADTERFDANVKNTKRAEYVQQYNEFLNQIDKLANDSGFNGVNLLGGQGNKLQVVFNEDGTSKLDINPVDFSSAGQLGLDVAVDTDFDTNDSVNAVLGTLKGALDTLRGQASKFGSNLAIVQARQDFTKNMINTLTAGASNLTLADSNEEGANMLALQTRQQLSTTALSMASQADQNVLRLF